MALISPRLNAETNGFSQEASHGEGRATGPWLAEASIGITEVTENDPILRCLCFLL
jgi:hypothetical protein